MNPFAWRRRKPLSPESAPPAQLDADIDDELAFHLQMAQRELIAAGASPEEAAAAARQRFGDPSAIRRQCRRIATGEHPMIKNILLAASAAVILVLATMCVHFFNVAQRARQDADVQRMRAEQELAKAEAAASFAQQLFVADVSVVERGSFVFPQIVEVGQALSRPAIAFPVELDVQIRAATQSAGIKRVACHGSAEGRPVPWIHNDRKRAR